MNTNITTNDNKITLTKEQFQKLTEILSLIEDDLVTFDTMYEVNTGKELDEYAKEMLSEITGMVSSLEGACELIEVDNDFSYFNSLLNNTRNVIGETTIIVDGVPILVEAEIY